MIWRPLWFFMFHLVQSNCAMWVIKKKINRYQAVEEVLQEVLPAERRGAEEAPVESRDLNLPAGLIWSFHLQPRALGADEKSCITDASCWIPFHLHGVTSPRGTAKRSFIPKEHVGVEHSQPRGIRHLSRKPSEDLPHFAPGRGNPTGTVVHVLWPDRRWRGRN